MKRPALLTSIAMLALAACTLPSPASADDAVQASVGSLLTPTTNSSLIAVTNNGNPLSPGTFAVGTIQLFYTVKGYTFPTGDFATFGLYLASRLGSKTGSQTLYPVSLDLTQTGSQNLTLTATPNHFDLPSSPWSASAGVTISIPSFVASDPDLNCDGCNLVGNLQIVAPGRNHLDTPTTVQVHIKLAWPKACLGVYNFLTDEAFTTVVTSTVVNMGGKNNSKVVSTTPFGQFSDNVLVVNHCDAPQSFNLAIALDGHFETNPRNNPGNAVFTYLASGYYDPDPSSLTFVGTGGTRQHQNLWLTGITVPAGYSFLVTVHIQLHKGESLSWLPLTSTSGGIFDGFSAALYTPSTTLTSLSPINLTPLATPNPDTAPVSFTVQ